MPNQHKYKLITQQKRGMSVERLSALLKKWQKQLLMDDWQIDLEIVEFLREDFRQSGDFIADPQQKTATVLLTWDPWRGDEEYTLLHELIHILVYEFDSFAESQILKSTNNDSKIQDQYLGSLEDLVHSLTNIILGRKERLNKVK